MKYIFSLLFVLVLAVAACTSDFIEPNLKHKTVTLLSPPDNYRTTNFTNTFWWDELKGATSYRIQIVDSDFSYIRRLVLDSTVSSNKLSYTLAPGYYQWRVKALNNSSGTDFSSARSIRIDSTTNLANQSVSLVSPANNVYTNSTSNTFKWLSMYSATDYRFQLFDLSNGSTITDITLQTDSFVYTLGQGQYKWQVRAQNTTSNSPYSSRTINIDTSPPNAPTPLGPANGATLPNPVALSWNRDNSAVGDSLFIYADSLYVTRLVNIYTTNTSYNYTGVSTQPYFWRVKSTDVAGNWSAYSALRKFIVQ
ncbi:MAG TPA: hypothetical protein VI112_02280 [Bacteroidia bacterium]